jgi:hypothetical protein
VGDVGGKGGIVSIHRHPSPIARHLPPDLAGDG